MWPYLFGSGWAWGIAIAAGLSAAIVGIVALMFAATAPVATGGTAMRQLAEVHRFRVRSTARPADDDAAMADAAG